MISVQLTEEEARLLVHALGTLLSDIRMEMCDTDRADFREGLKQEKSALQHVITQLEASLPA